MAASRVHMAHHRGHGLIRSVNVGLLLITVAFLVVVVRLGQQVRHEVSYGPTVAESGDWLQGWRLNGLLYSSHSAMWSVEDRLHIIFSTDCTSFQHWQALLLLESAARVGQRGAITRIVSGCEKIVAFTNEPQLSPITISSDHAAMEDAYKTFKFHLHFVPDMMGLGNSTDKTYKFANKAHTLHHWLDVMDGGTMWDVGGNPDDHDVIITSIDPDFLFLKPFDAAALHISDGDSAPSSAREESQAMIQRLKGHPRGQSYGLGYGWLRFDRAKMCGPDSPAAKVDQAEAEKYYNVGPPYSMHRSDWVRFLDAWTGLIPKIYDDYLLVEGLKDDPTRHYCEMYAYAMASADLGLKHQMLHDEMVGCMVGWPKQHMIRTNATHTCGRTAVTGDALPAFIHYCQRHEEKGWWFTKRMVPHDIIPSCGPHVLEPPPEELFSLEQEEGFIICVMTEAVNHAAIHYRASACGIERPDLIYDFRLGEGTSSARPNQGKRVSEIKREANGLRVQQKKST